MFSIEAVQFGSFNALHFKHSLVNVNMVLVPELGGSVQELHLINPTGIEADVIEGFNEDITSAEVAEKGFHSSLLFPFVNRLDGGNYSWLGNNLQFEINEPTRENALHGLVYNQPFEVVSQTSTDESATCILTPKQTEANKAYPFTHKLLVTYTLHVKYGLSVKMEIENLHSDSIPISVGWHPYIKLSKRSACLLKLPAYEQYALGDRMIPTGETMLKDKYTSFHLIDESFDDGFQIQIKSGRQEICISDPARHITITCWQHAGPSALNYFQIYTSPTRESVAIEPLSSAANAFQNGDGLITLESKSKAQFDFGIYLT